MRNYKELNTYVSKTYDWFIDFSTIGKTGTVYMRPQTVLGGLIKTPPFYSSDDKLYAENRIRNDYYEDNSFTFMELDDEQFSSLNENEWLLEMESVNTLYEKYKKVCDDVNNVDECILCDQVMIKEQLESYYCWQCTCDHTITTYQPEEKDTNATESLTCDECGTDLPLEDAPDYD